jgi:hypothetical protein
METFGSFAMRGMQELKQTPGAFDVNMHAVATNWLPAEMISSGMHRPSPPAAAAQSLN